MKAKVMLAVLSLVLTTGLVATLCGSERVGCWKCDKEMNCSEEQKDNCKTYKENVGEGEWEYSCVGSCVKSDAGGKVMTCTKTTRDSSCTHTGEIACEGVVQARDCTTITVGTGEKCTMNCEGNWVDEPAGTAIVNCE